MKWLYLLLFFVAAQAQGQETSLNRLAAFPTSEGTYIFDDWKYTFSITSPKTRSQGTWGRLYYKGKEMAAPKNTVVNTPVGEFVFLGGFEGMGWGEHGWLNTYVDYNGISNPIFQPDGTLRASSQIEAKRISISELLDLNKDGAYQAKQSRDWRTAKIGASVAITERDNGFLKYRGQVNGCDVVALSTDIGSAMSSEDLRIYVLRSKQMVKVLSLGVAQRQGFVIRETKGSLNVFLVKSAWAPTESELSASPVIIIDLQKLMQAYEDGTTLTKGLTDQ